MLGEGIIDFFHEYRQEKWQTTQTSCRSFATLQSVRYGYVEIDVDFPCPVLVILFRGLPWLRRIPHIQQPCILALWDLELWHVLSSASVKHGLGLSKTI